MKKYELIVLFAESISAEDQEKVLAKIGKDLLDLGGKLEEKNSMGKKELAYIINKEKRASYWNLAIDLSADNMSAFRRKLTLNDSILRFLLVVKD